MSFESKGNNNRQIRKKDMRMSQPCNCEKYMKKYDQFGQVPSTAKYMVPPKGVRYVGSPKYMVHFFIFITPLNMS